MDSHHILDAPTAIAILESREGGRWYERADHGSECDWGYVREIDRPTRILLAWHLTPGVEVRSRSREDDGAVVIPLDVTATGVGSGAPIDQTYWLGARVQADKIIFFGFFRTESDAMDEVT